MSSTRDQKKPIQNVRRTGLASVIPRASESRMIAIPIIMANEMNSSDPEKNAPRKKATSATRASMVRIENLMVNRFPAIWPWASHDCSRDRQHTVFCRKDLYPKTFQALRKRTWAGTPGGTLNHKLMIVAETKNQDFPGRGAGNPSSQKPFQARDSGQTNSRLNGTLANSPPGPPAWMQLSNQFGGVNFRMNKPP